MNRLKILLVVAAFAMETAHSKTVHVDAETVKLKWATALDSQPEQVVFARHVNFTLIRRFKEARLVRGQIPSNFQSAVLALTSSALLILSDNASRPEQLMKLTSSAISGISVQSMTTTLTREHLEQIQIEVGNTLLVLTCSDSTDRIGGKSEETRATYQQLIDAGLPAGMPHPWVIQSLNVPVPITIP